MSEKISEPSESSEKSDQEKWAERYEIVAEKFRKIGRLGVTAQDHHAIGSTPSDIMEKNPDKTMGELMSPEQIEKWLSKNSTDKEIDEKYLKSIGRFPVDKNN